MPPEIATWFVTQGPLGVFLAYVIWNNGKQAEKYESLLREVLTALTNSAHTGEKLAEKIGAILNRERQ